jgi:TonB-dependent SusC/RagA subfamily outer membrane receptor
MKIRLLVLLIFGLSLQSIANDNFNPIDISGKITDPEGKPLSGVSIQEKGTGNGVVSKEDGTFSISVTDNNAVLVISSIGFATREVGIKGSSVLNISMQRTSDELEKVVVVGYGTQRKIDVTGSVASVNLESMKEIPNTNIGQLLQGQVPGLNVGLSTFAGGTPPINIRGQNTLGGSTTVLIILDGIQYTQSLSSINPDDIASIDVLKDASSTAVYGAQAANGVILITTRKGRNNQKPRIAISSSYSSQKPTENLRPMKLDEYLNNVREAYYNLSYIGPDYTQPNTAFNVNQYVDATMRDGAGNLLPNNFNWW